MRISQVRIHNYRSIRDLSFDVTELTVLLGPNNHGKSNILRAIEFALSTSAKVDSDDLFALREDGDDDLWVELTFVDLTEQERTTFEKYLRNDGSIRIRKTARLGASGATEVEYRGYAEEPDLWWLKATAADRLGTREAVQAEGEAVPDLLSLLDGSGRITRQRLEEFQKSYIEQHRNSLTFHEVGSARPFAEAGGAGGSGGDPWGKGVADSTDGWDPAICGDAGSAGARGPLRPGGGSPGRFL